MRFSGQTVAITGAAGTIGRAVAEAFYKEGANLALIDANPEALEAFTSGFEDQNRILALTVDMTDEPQVESAVNKIVDRFGSIDVFHNNAGITGQRAHIVDFDFDKYQKLMQVNVIGIALGLKYVLRQMYKQNSGSVINTASQKGKLVAAGSADYASSKSAVIALTKAAALESADHNIRVNCIMPGIVRSPMIIHTNRKRYPDKTDEEIEKIYAAGIPLKRLASPEEVAGLVVFLASSESSYITGSELRLDGGSTACAI